ncbi:hypothetical protein [Paenibacillus sp. GCM10028914]|uniref:hypothetical protein n=1 Tax=Paenibacillus sp. GCM10028914 TaxID=3273416 RepID=UPI00361EA3EF
MKMKNNKKSMIFAVLCLISISGTSIYAGGAHDYLFPEIEPQYQEQAQEVQNKLENSWDRGKEIILAKLRVSEGQIANDWRLVDVVRLNENLLNSFRDAEKSSFIDAFFSEERKKNLEVGDLMPALLINPDQTEAKQFWEKHDGSYIVINLKSKKKNGLREWLVDGYYLTTE